MQPSPYPACPRCGQTPEKISERRADLNGGFFEKPAGSPKETQYVFQCKCGTSFTHSVVAGQQLEPDKNQDTMLTAERAALESMTPMELDCEYARVVGELPPEVLSRDALIEKVLAKVERVRIAS
jgi:hypothetical protein